jgi:LmbE family N-acetylglucosaminyl deacetylase
MTQQPSGLDAFADLKRLIVVAAHPDDLECVCGGAVALLVERGVEVYSLNCTLGDIGARVPTTARSALAATRQAETAAAGRLLGLKGVYHLGYPDGELAPTLEVRAQIARFYRATQADTLFTFDPFWSGQIHPDHRAAGQAALDAYMPSKMPLYRREQLTGDGASLGRLERIFFFSTDREPDIYIDITSVYTRKVAACLAHRSQFPDGEESLQWLKEWDAETGKRIEATYAEAFKRVRVW